MKTNVDAPVPIEPKDEYIVKLPIILSLYTVLHVAMLVTGFVYADACPVEPNIPLFLKLQGESMFSEKTFVHHLFFRNYWSHVENHRFY